MLEVRHFEIVEAIAGAGSVTAAARRLHLTQPAVSHALGDLERRLGLPLFLREARGMVLTEEGERVRAAGKTVLATVREVEHDLRLFREGCRGILRVSTECYTAYHWLPPVLRHFRERFEELEVQIVPDATTDPVAALLDERLDLAIVHSPVDHPDLLTERLFEDEIVAVVASDDPLATASCVRPEDFEDRVLLMHSRAPESALMREVLDPAGVSPGRVAELHLTEAVLQSVRAGLGLTAMARWVVEPELEREGLVVLPIGDSGLVRTWQLATRRELARRVSVQELARLLKGARPDED